MAGLSFRGKASDPAARRVTWADMARIAAASGVAMAAVEAIMEVEANGAGFLPDGRLKVLFEAHWFDRLTEGRFRVSHPDLSSAVWDKTLYLGGAAEHVRLGRAMELDREAALKSASWGAGQIMGFNHFHVGYLTVEAMIRAFADDASTHVAAVLAFLDHARALDAVRACDWARVARAYNGPGYRANRYHHKLAVAFAARSGLTGVAPGAAGEDVRRLQIALKAAREEPGPADGAMGPKTADALLAFQKRTRKPFPPEPREV